MTDTNGKTVFSGAAKLTVKPKITSQPKTVTTVAGTTASFKVKAAGDGLTYQWQWRTSSSGNWKNCTGATEGYNTATLRVSATTARHGYQYRCRVKNSSGNAAYTKAVTLNVLGIRTQPSSVSTAAGNTATFKVVATGIGKSYQWQYRTSSSGSWIDCSSATEGYNAATLKVAAKSYRNGYQYRCKVTDSAGNTVYSKAAKLTVTTADGPVIVTQPKDVTAGGECSEVTWLDLSPVAIFKVEAAGEGLQYQWEKKGNDGEWGAMGPCVAG